MANSSDMYGAEPQKITWQVVRGDFAKLRIEFWESDEVTPTNTTGWTYASAAKDVRTGTFYTLTTTSGYGYVEISAEPTTTKLWGTGNQELSTELDFDLQVTISGEPWTPVIGKIFSIPDVTGSNI